MPPIPIHSSDPISPAKAKNAPQLSSQAQDGVAHSANHLTAKPGQSVPTPTKTVTARYTDGPAAPRPGAAPIPAHPGTTAKASLPPPTWARETSLPAEAYKSPTRQTTAIHYPLQAVYSVDELQKAGVPSESVTATSTQSSFTPQTTLPKTGASRAPAPNLEHPPGYVQDKHATEMTPEQRRAAEQESTHLTESSPILEMPGSVHAETSNDSSLTAAGIWEGAKTLATQVGQKAEQLHGDIWNRVDGKK